MRRKKPRKSVSIDIFNREAIAKGISPKQAFLYGYYKGILTRKRNRIRLIERKSVIILENFRSW